MKISICVATYRRPEGIRRLLTALGAVDPPDPDAHIEVVVVDNDADGGARGVCDDVAGSLRWPVRYAVEPERGISHARNRALELADPRSDWIAILDDDEVPPADWLQQLLNVQRATAADVVGGPAVPHFERRTDTWIEAGGFFQPERHPNGSAIPYAYTNNVIFRGCLRRDPRLSPAFDPRYGLTGGEDQHYFERVKRAGYRLHWADAAEVTEWVAPDRTNARWLVRRQFRIGNALAHIQTELEPGLAPFLRRGARAVRELSRGLFALPAAWMRGTGEWVRERQRAAFGLGVLWGLVGGRYEGYR